MALLAFTINLGLALDAPDAVLDAGQLRSWLIGAVIGFAVPAVVRYAIPEANPSLYFGLSLGLTFPLNLLLGIPLYTQWALSTV